MCIRDSGFRCRRHVAYHRVGCRIDRRKLDSNDLGIGADLFRLWPGEQIGDDAGMNGDDDHGRRDLAVQFPRIAILMPRQHQGAHFACRISSPTKAIFRYRAARSSFITVITSPYGTCLLYTSRCV